MPLLSEHELAVVVAVIAVRLVRVHVDEVVDGIAVGNRLLSAAGAVLAITLALRAAVAQLTGMRTILSIVRPCLAAL